MNDIIEFLKTLHSAEGLKNLVQSGGLGLLIAIIFAETGLLAGFFLPGDSLLVTAGVFASTDGMGGSGIFSLPVLLITLSLAAIIGDQVGYYLGMKAGPKIYRQEDTLFFKKKHLIAAQDFYQKHGGRAVIIARFIPIFRTFVPFAAGMAKMPYEKYVKVNIIGGLVWVNSLVPLGYFLGKSPLADQLHKIILLVIFISILPILVGATKAFLNKYKKSKI